MELFLAQNHSAMTHLPIAASILAAVAALAAVFVRRREVSLFWAVLSLAALVSALPTIVTGVAAAKGRTNEQGQAYVRGGLLVERVPQNTRIFRHQILGVSGTAVAAILSALAIARLRGRNPSRSLVAFLAVLMSLLWGIGGHLGGEELWGPDTFPALHGAPAVSPQDAKGSGSTPGK